MYRDWRELTKTLLATKGSLSNAKLSSMRMKRPETKLYVKWVKEQIQKDRKQFDDYAKGKGIIRTRERFLQWMETQNSGASEKSQPNSPDVPLELNAADVQPPPAFGKTIIVPVAVPGCGESFIGSVLEDWLILLCERQDRYLNCAPAFIWVCAHAKR